MPGAGRIEEDCKYLDILPALSQVAESDDTRVRRAAQFAMHKICASRYTQQPLFVLMVAAVAMMDAQNAIFAEGDTEVEAPLERGLSLIGPCVLDVADRRPILERTLYKLAKAGVVRALVQLAQADDVKVRQHAVRGLANFAQSGSSLPWGRLC
jgi:hypothetical protein